MFQYVFNEGSTLDIVVALGSNNLPEYLFGLVTQQVMNDEIRILVDTSVPRTIILPSSVDFPVRNVKITVTDITGGAEVNPITVIPAISSSDTINGGSSQIVNTPFGSISVSVITENSWYVQGGNLGTGGGSTASFTNFSVTIPNATVYQMLLDGVTTFEILPALGAGNFAGFATLYTTLIGRTAFSLPPSPPQSLVMDGYSNTLGGSGKIAFSVGALEQPYFIGNASSIMAAAGAGLVAPNQPILLIAKSAFPTVINGDCDLEIFGSYQILNIPSS